MEIFMRAHQVRALKDHMELGIPNDFSQKYGESALSRLQAIIAMIATDPYQMIRVVQIYAGDSRYSGQSVCGADCDKVKRDPYIYCQDPQSALEENQIASGMGIKLGRAYPASYLLSLV